MEMIAEVVLKNQSGQYARVSGAHIVLGKASFDAKQHTFQLYVDATGKKIALKAPNNQFLYAEKGGGTWIRPERSRIGGHETFKLLRQSNATETLFTLQCFSGHYVSMPSNAKVTSTKNIGKDERFSIVLVANASVLLDQRTKYTQLKTQNSQLETAKKQALSAQRALTGSNKSLQTLVGKLQADIKVQQKTNQAVLSKLDDLNKADTKLQLLEAVEQAVAILTEAQGEAPDVDAVLQKIQAEQEQRIQVLEIQHQANSASAAASQYADEAQVAATAAALFATTAQQAATTAKTLEPNSPGAIAAAAAANQAQVAAKTAQEQTTLAASAKEAARQHTAMALAALGQPDAPMAAARTELEPEPNLSDKDIAQARTAATAATEEQAKAQAAAQSALENHNIAASAAETAAQQAAQTEQTYDNWSAVSALFGITDSALAATEPDTDTGSDKHTDPNPNPATDKTETPVETNGLVATDNWAAVATLFGLENSTASNPEEQATTTTVVASS